MNNRTFYNPDTNHIKRTGFYATNDGYVCLGTRKVAEAFTSVSPEERPKLWLALHGNTWGIDFSMLSSKIRHKLAKLGMRELSKFSKCGGEALLEKIKSK